MRNISFVFAVFIACLLLTSCTQEAREDAFWEDNKYASTFRLYSSDGLRKYGGSIDSLSKRFPTIKKILWLETLPKDIPDDTLIYYPSRYSKISLDIINEVVQAKQIDLSEFELTYPVTIQDILNNHETMLKLVGSFDDEDKYRFNYWEPEESQEWRRTTEYASTFGIKNNRDVFDYKSGVGIDYSLYREILWLEELPAEVDDNVMVFYATEKTIILANNLTKAAEKDKLNLADYGLSNPISVQDILTKHDAMDNLRGDLTEETDAAYFTSEKLW
jgi:hypothetical protein